MRRSPQSASADAVHAECDPSPSPDAEADLAAQAWWSAEERKNLTRRSTLLGVAIFVLDVVLYAGATVLAVAPMPLALNLFFSVWAGFMTGQLFTVGHDACHQALTDNRTLNIWIARLAFLPALQSQSMWDLSHNRIHHRYTNLRGFDPVWEPMSPEDYRAAPLLRRALYRLYRSPLGPLPYYAMLWWKTYFLPLGTTPEYAFARHRFDTIFLLVTYPLLVAGILTLGATLDPDRALWLTALLGWIIPFLAWQWVMGFVIYAHHTHPEVAWLATREEWSFYRSQVLGTVHSRLPQPLHTFSNNIMEHTAHHMLPAIPLYRLREAQASVRSRVPAVKFSRLSREYLRTVKACKLFDYDRRQWVDFDGNPTGPVILRNGVL